MSEQFPQSQEQQPVRVPVLVRTPVQKPMVTYVLIGVTVIAYGLQWLSKLMVSGGYDLPMLLGAKINEYILLGQIWRLITPVMLHGSLLHIAFNMYALFSIGPSLERHYGHWRFLLLYLVGGFAGNTLSFLLSPNPSVGASTAVFGLVAAEAVFILKNRELFGGRARGILMNLGMVIVVNLAIGMRPGIDNWGHLGGLLGGAIFAWVSGPLLKVQTTLQGYELVDSRTRRDIFWGLLLSGGLFLAAVIGRMLAG